MNNPPVITNKGNLMLQAENKTWGDTMSYLQSLSVFIAVAEERNFTAAAKKLNLTQPTVSFHMDNLEKSLGCMLFHRTSKGVTLTPYGKRLYESACIVDTTLRTTYQEIQRMAEGCAGHISLGASTIPGEYILPSLISTFIRETEGFQFSLTTGDSKFILDSFLAGRYAIAITGTKPVGLEFIELWNDELILVGHPELIGNMSPSSCDLFTQLPLILRSEPSGSRRTALEALEQLGIRSAELNIVLEVTGNQALKAAIMNRAGVGFVSKWAVCEELAEGKLITLSLPGPRITRSFFLMFNPQAETAGVRRFIDFLVNSKEKVCESRRN